MLTYIDYNCDNTHTRKRSNIWKKKKKKSQVISILSSDTPDDHRCLDLHPAKSKNPQSASVFLYQNIPLGDEKPCSHTSTHAFKIKAAQLFFRQVSQRPGWGQLNHVHVNLSHIDWIFIICTEDITSHKIL